MFANIPLSHEQKNGGVTNALHSSTHIQKLAGSISMESNKSVNLEDSRLELEDNAKLLLNLYLIHLIHVMQNLSVSVCKNTDQSWHNFLKRNTESDKKVIK